MTILFSSRDREAIDPHVSPDFHPHETLVSLFRKTAHSVPGNIAVDFNGSKLSYEELDQRSNQLARLLTAHGVKKGSYVPVYLERSVEWVIAVLAVLKTGAAYVPIDAAYPPKRVAFIIADVEATVIITQSSLFSRSVQLQDTTVLYSDKLPALPAPEPLELVPDADDLAYVIYTSGSTGQPKGVMVTHKAVQHLITWHIRHFGVSKECRLTLVAGLAFDISVWELWSALLSGATLFIATDEERIDTAQLFAFYERNGITHAYTPAVLAPEIVALSREQSGLQLQYLFTGGEKLKPVLTDGLSYQLVDYYGPTEYTIFATWRQVRDVNGAYVSSIGQPIPGTRALILDQHLQPVAESAVGELCLSGIGIAKGYLHNQQLTDTKFVDHPFAPGQKLYKTGDLARWLPDGSIEFLGRIDNQVKIRGFRVELGEVEKALTLLSHISNAAVITMENSRKNKYLVAFIVQEHPNEQQGIALARQQLREELPGYMIPARFICLNEIPVTANGKMDKARLVALAEQAAPENMEQEEGGTATEQLIAQVWAGLLERPFVHYTDSFFDIGGDSLLVAAMATQLRSRLNMKIYIRDVYQFPVLRALAAEIDNRTKLASTVEPGLEDVEPYVELQKDAWLLPDVTFRNDFDYSVLEHQSAVMLTGATGFVGIHLLQELLDHTRATVYCLVRAKDEYHAMEKIYHTFTTYHINIREAQKHRIIPVVGDFSQQHLGLSQEKFDELAEKLEVVYHSGSSVNFIEPYSYMKRPNVDGLREIIRFAGAGKTKCLALLSTISVYSWGHVFTGKTVMKETDDIAQNLLAVSKDIGYVRSKWVMEAVADLAAAQGLPVITYRLGYAMCHSESGASAPYQWWSGLVKNCVEYGSYPLLRELREGLITVDYMAKAIVHITKNRNAIGQKFNLIASPEHNLTLTAFFDLLLQHYDLKMKGLPYKEWRKQWEDEPTNRLYPLTSLFRDNMHEGLSTVELYQDTYEWHKDNVDEFLHGSGIEEPVFDKQLLDRYLGYLGITAKERVS
ncbi:amino acid adenylation domain-containing protein [Chitinophaga sp. 212800010-3]|uniref:non-ribosomal peptide synthetase family protein n=1 Tax=unclassified Chitinophaga TaxID=2619133 RepID=UPI002DF652F3|nr:hypothetical protein [Chitinophaga sp. 212800010-3]